MTGKKTFDSGHCYLDLLFYTVTLVPIHRKEDKSGSPGFADQEMAGYSRQNKGDKVLNGDELGPKISILSQVDIDVHGWQRDILRCKLTINKSLCYFLRRLFNDEL